MIHELHEMLGKVRSRARKLWGRWALALCWLVWAAIAWGLWSNASRFSFTGPQLATAIAVGALLTAIACRAIIARRTRDPHWVAQQIEAKHPELGAALLAALEQAPSPRYYRMGYLQRAVVREAVSHGRQHNWARDVPVTLLGTAQLAQLAAFGLLVGACILLSTRGDALASSTGDAMQLAEGHDAFDTSVSIKPGDTEIERGTTLLVIADFGQAVPTESTLVFEPLTPSDVDSSEQGITSRSMARSFDDPKFVGRVPAVREDLSYYVEFDSTRTQQYRVTVFDYPACGPSGIRCSERKVSTFCRKSAR